MAISKTNSTHYLKKKYPDAVKYAMGESYGKFLAMVRKKTDGLGEGLDIGVEHGRLPSTGADFDKAQTLAGSQKPANKKFSVTEVTHYTIARITGQIIRKTKAGDSGIFKAALNNKSRTAFNTEIHCLSRAVYDTGYGVIGRIASGGVSSATVTLDNKEDAINFDVGMEVGFVDGSGGDETAAMRDSGAALGVASVDRSAGTVTFDANVSTVSGAAALDYLVRDGDRGTGSSPTKLMPSGLKGWCPDSVASSGDSFFGVDRYTDVTRLAGHRIGGLNKTVREAFIDATFEVMNDGATVTTIFCHPAKFGQLAKDVEAQKLFNATSFKSYKAELSIPGAKVMTPYGEVNIIPDAYCPVDRAWALDLSTIELRSEGTWPDFLTFDDGNFITVDGADQGEVRVGGDMQLVCYSPNRMCLVNFDSAT